MPRGSVRKHPLPQPGKPFGQLTVIEEVPIPLRWQGTYRAKYHWYRCQCTCGQETILPHNTLHSGNTKSCGCLQREAAKRVGAQKGVHRESGLAGVRPQSKEYRAWLNMKRRCLDTKGRRYADWGGRGITVYPQWLTSYETFLAYIGRAPSSHHSLDRIDNDGPYQPGNVRWATRTEQGLHTRQTPYLTFQNETLSLNQWEDRIGFPHGTLHSRLNRYGYTIEQALTLPLRHPRPRS